MNLLFGNKGYINPHMFLNYFKLSMLMLLVFKPTGINSARFMPVDNQNFPRQTIYRTFIDTIIIDGTEYISTCTDIQITSKTVTQSVIIHIL